MNTFPRKRLFTLALFSIAVAASVLPKASFSADQLAPNVAKPSTGMFINILVTDIDKARTFYRELFDWKFTSSASANFYYMDMGVTGLTGGVQRVEELSSNDQQRVAVYVKVRKIQDVLQKAKKLGGTIESLPRPLSGGKGTISQIRDPDWNIVGVYSDENLPNP